MDHAFSNVVTSALHRFHEFATRAQWAAAIASELARDLGQDLAAGKNAAMVVPGGNTPAPILAELARAKIAWSRVHLCLTDERWVPPDHPDSNERSIRANLIEKGAGAKLHSLWARTPRPSDGLAAIEREIARMPRPFSAILIGMGEDGHFASLFPGTAETPPALNPRNPNSCVAIDAPQNGHPRMSLTLAALIDTRRTRLAIAGAAKRSMVEAAINGAAGAVPISALLGQDRTPVDVFWAP